MRDLSQHSGIPYSTIYDVLESGKTQPDNLTARNLKRLARTLGTSIDHLEGTWEDDAVGAVSYVGLNRVSQPTRSSGPSPVAASQR
jgi:predicted transcriptional regulator